VTGIACIVCNILNFLIYYFYVTRGFLASPVLLACTALVIIGLVVLALALPARLRVAANVNSTSLWLIGVVVFLVGLYWLGIHELISPTFPVPALALIAIGAVLVAGMAWLLNRWSLREGWERTAYLRTLVAGSLLAGALIGAKIVEDGNPIDQLGQAALAIILVVFLVIWERKSITRTV
jgi:apolipoprotein N-acyltransferase